MSEPQVAEGEDETILGISSESIEVVESVYVSEEIIETEVVLELPQPIFMPEPEAAPVVVAPEPLTSEPQSSEVNKEVVSVVPESVVLFASTDQLPQIQITENPLKEEEKAVDSQELSVIPVVSSVPEVALIEVPIPKTTILEEAPIEQVLQMLNDEKPRIVREPEIVAKPVEKIAIPEGLPEEKQNKPDASLPFPRERIIPSIAQETPLTDTLEQVVHLFTAEAGDEPVSVEIMVQHHEEAVPLQITQTEGKITVSAGKLQPSEEESIQKDEIMTPLTTVSELGAALATVEALLALPLPEVTDPDHPEVAEQTASEFDVVVSEPMLAFLDVLKTFASDSVTPEQPREGNQERTVHFTTTGEEAHDFSVTQEQFADMRLLFSILEGKEEKGDREETAGEVRTEQASEPIEAELTLVLAAVREREAVAENLTQEPADLDLTMTVSAEVMAVIAQSLQVIEAFEKLKANTAPEKTGELIPEEDANPKQQITIVAAGKELTVDAATLQLVMKLHKKKRQLRKIRFVPESEGAPEELEQNTLLQQRSKTQPQLVTYQTLSIFLVLLDAQLSYYRTLQYEFFPQPVLHA